VKRRQVPGLPPMKIEVTEHQLTEREGGCAHQTVTQGGRRPPRGPCSAAARWGDGPGFCRSISRQIGMSRASEATVLYLCWIARSGPFSPTLSTTQNRHICAPPPAELGAAVSVRNGGYARGCRRMVDHALRSASEPEARTTLPEPRRRTHSVVVSGHPSQRQMRTFTPSLPMHKSACCTKTVCWASVGSECCQRRLFDCRVGRPRLRRSSLAPGWRSFSSGSVCATG